MIPTPDCVFSPDDHTSKVENHFKASYQKHMRESLKFKAEINHKAEDTLLKISKAMGEKSKGKYKVSFHLFLSFNVKYIFQF